MDRPVELVRAGLRDAEKLRFHRREFDFKERGFSLALGAFLAGLVLSQTNENLAIFSEVRPLRDVFLVIFFVSLGSSLAPSFLLANWLTILVLSGLILLLKIVLGILNLHWRKRERLLSYI